MSKTAQPDEIDQLVSSVRDFVSHKEPKHTRLTHAADRLVLTADQRVSDTEVEDEDVFFEENDGIDHSNVLVLDTKKPSTGTTLEATIAELEAAVTAQSDDWEPDEGEIFEHAEWAESAFPTGEVDSHVVIESAEEIRQESADNQATEHPDAEPAEAVRDTSDLTRYELPIGMDEAALRKLVAQVVHEELTGELGERITHNVRKLVRREINRVLTSRAMGQD